MANGFGQMPRKSIHEYLQAMNISQNMIDKHLKKEEEMDVMIEINLCQTQFKIKSFTFENEPRVLSIAIGKEIVEGSRRTLVTSERPVKVVMKSTVSGFAEYWDTKEIVSINDIKVSDDYPDILENLLKQTIKVENHEARRN